MKRLAALLAAALLAAGAHAADAIPAARNTFPALGAPDDPRVPISWNKFHDTEGLNALLRALAAAHPRLARVTTLGKSVEGRDLLALEIGNPDTGDNSRKPGFYIDGNIHGNEVQAAETVLYTAWYLLEMYGRVELVTKLVDERVFYLVPTINPDGRDAWFHEPANPHLSRGGRLPVDNDGDGLLDEDGPEDINGDGQITSMRVKDPFGRYKVDPEFPESLMYEVEPEERGDYRLIRTEGIDNDGDGEINEDGPGGYDPNRNWAWDWAPESIQFGAHDYPFSLPETRAVRDYVLARPNIAAAQSYHNNGGMILRGPGREGGRVHPEDERIWAQIGQRGTEMLPYYRNMISWKDLYTVWGGEIEWFYGVVGVTAFTNELWTEDNLYRRGLPGGEDGRRERMKWVRRLLLNQGLTPWQEVDHPTYGKVEVGGMASTWGRVPPSFLLEEELHRNTMFTLYHAECMPLLRPGETKVRALGNGLYRIDHAVENHGTLPTRTSHDVEKGITPDNTVSLTGLKVIASGVVEDPDFDRVKWQPRRPETLRVDRFRGMRRQFVAFVVSGTGNATLEVSAQRGGTYRIEVQVKAP